MNRTEKQAFVDDIGDRLLKSQLLVLADYTGMTVETMNKFRRQLDSEKSIEFRVVKNTLCSRAVSGTPMEVLTEYFRGPTAVLMGHDDPMSPAKVVQDFLKENAKVFKIKAGFFSGKLINEQELKELSKLPSREELLSQLLGTLQAPLSQFVGVLAAVPQKFIGVLAAYQKKLEEEGA